MKRILSMLLVLIFVAGALALSACSGGGDETSKSQAADTTGGQTAAPTQTPVNPTGSQENTAETPTNTTQTPVNPTESQGETTQTPVNPTETTATPTQTPVNPTETPATPTETPATPTETQETTTVTPTAVVIDPTDGIFNTLPRTTTKTEHKKADSLPASFTLVGADTLPAVYQRSEDISNPAADAVTYMQYTNAVARYIKSKDSTSTISPSTERNDCFSTKYAGQFGLSIADDYHVLMDNGALTFAEDDFHRSGSGDPIIKESGKYDAQTVGWKIDEGTGDKSLAYRLVNYEDVNAADNTKPIEISLTDGGGYYNNRYGSIEITENDNGKELLKKIKDALVTGNVVVTQGKYYTWRYEQLPAEAGQSVDTVIAYAVKLSDADANDKTRNIDYPLCIVGYDDTLEYTTHDVTTTGAFLVCNPGDMSWGNDGYAWVMYDALNTYYKCLSDTSSKEQFVLENDTDVRTAVFSRYCFVYWDKDITDEKPALYAEIELEASNRNTFQFLLTKTDVYGRTSSIYAWQSYMTAHKLYDTYGLDTESEDYFNPAGVLNGGEARGFYTVNFTRLLGNLPVGTTFEDFSLGLRVYNSDEKYPVTINSITFKDSTGAVIKKVTMPRNTSVTKSYFNIQINFGKEQTRDILVGNYYTFKNVKTGQYLLKDSNVPPVYLGDYAAKKVCWFHIEYSSEKNNYKLLWKKKTGDYTMPLDLQDKKVPEEGALPFINPMDASTREATTRWNISYNDDGTFSLYFKNEAGEYFALAAPESGKYPMLKKVTELTDDIKWELITDYDDSYKSPYICTATKEDSAVTAKAESVFSKQQRTDLGDDVTLTATVYNIETGRKINAVDFQLDNNNLDVSVTAANLPDEYLLIITNTAKTTDGTDYTMYPVNATLVINL